jgi:hypothetical protein
MNQKRKLPEEIKVLLKHLVISGEMRIARKVLFLYLKEEMQFDESFEAYSMRRYFQMYHPSDLQKYRQQESNVY